MEEEVKCLKCDLLMELYKQAPQTARNYWIMTELFCYMHDGDVCNKNKEKENANGRH